MAGREGVTVVVHDIIPLSRQGLCASLTEGGFRTEALGNESVSSRDVTAAVVAVREDQDTERIELIRAHDAILPIIALVADEAVEWYTRALRSGSTSALPWSVEPRMILAALDLAVCGLTLLPTGVTRLLTNDVREAAPTDLTATERMWLERLSAGTTIADLARDAGYSERAMYRLLNVLYTRIGVGSRSEAIARAAMWRHLDIA